jgi:histidinol-phosphate aminotransferase
MNIKNLVKPNILSLRAYQAEEITCKVKLDANESPYGFSAIKSVKTNRYPDPEAKELRKLIAKDLNVKIENVLHGNGSDELIYNLILTFGGPVLYPTPTFSMYGIIAQALGEKYAEMPLDEKFDLDTDKMLKKIKTLKPKLIFLSSPNNPTGNSFSTNRVMKIIRQSRGLIVVDEAYQQFSPNKSFIPLLKKHKNLIVLRTLSKVGLAGVRKGFLISHKDIVNEANKVRLPFNLNALSQKVAVDALKSKSKMRSGIRLIISERNKLFKEMKKMWDVETYPSDANFIFFKVRNSDKIFKALLNRGVLIRNMKRIKEGYLRVTVGTPKENNIFIKNLKQLL